MQGKTLSVFVDESGILNESAVSSRFYILTLVLHDQDHAIDKFAAAFDRDLERIGVSNLCFHGGPLIRMHEGFEFMNWDWRRKIFARMLGFARSVDFKYHCLCVDKKFTDTVGQIIEKLEKQLTDFLANHQELAAFEKVKVYYDCGQKPITNFLHGFFERNVPSVEFAQSVLQRKYRLAQIADLVCTIKLTELKLDAGLPLSASEKRFFGGPRDFKRNILKKIKTKEIR